MTDKKYYSAGIISGNLAPATVGEPRIYGAEVTYRFEQRQSGRAWQGRASLPDLQPDTDRIGLDETSRVFEALRQRTTQCKVLIDPWKDRPRTEQPTRARSKCAGTNARAGLAPIRGWSSSANCAPICRATRPP